MAVTTEAQRISEYGICSGVNRGTVNLWTSAVKSVPFWTNADLIPAWEVLAGILKRHEYWVDPTQTGSYNCRHIGNDPSKPWSPHASGSAFDLNWRRNPVGRPIVTDMPAEMVLEIVSVVTGDGVPVFRWGADWDRDGDWTDHSFVDPMHFEIIAEIRHLDSGIVDPGADEMTPEQEATLAYWGEVKAKLQGEHGWTSADNTAKRFEYSDRLRNGLAARTGVGGDNGAAIADAMALLSDIVSNGGSGVVLGETYTVTLGDLP